ncbi:MAG: hypothetical protein HZA17_04155 [Nitrospirae bacterium]|nr:hypothetical protein [Nitrospirota bacterium]
MKIKEDIAVLASFGRPYRIKPLSFTWYGRAVEVKEVAYTLNDKFGDFTVTWASYMKTMEPPSVISPAWRPCGVRNVSIKK